MSVGPQPIFGRTQDQAVLAELLHSLSQPLTSLRCSLELSVEDIAGQSQNTVSAALEQTDCVIAVVRLMREYLDTEPLTVAQPPVPLGPVLRSVADQLAQVAAERQVQLQLTGGCSSTVALAEPRLRLALQYLIGSLIEELPRHRHITLRLEQGASESELRAYVERPDVKSAIVASKSDSVTATLHNVQRAIARRMLESAGAMLTFEGGDHLGFLLRIPRPPRPPLSEPFS
jgi:signal transduction histidine kinase